MVTRNVPYSGTPFKRAGTISCNPDVRFVEYTPPSTAGHLALDEALLNLRETEPGEGFLRFWEPRELSVVLGRTNNPETEVRLDRCRARGIPLFRRSSGGGTVVQGPGCLNFTLVVNIADDPRLESAGATNEYVLRRNAGVISILTGKDVGVSGSSDLTIDGRKISGNAQRRRLRTVLFHGCILLDFDFGVIEDLLPFPSRQPEYRAGRTHAEFLRNLRIEAGTLKGALRNTWGAALAAADVPIDETERLAREKYMNPAWTYK
jgi:lipoate-protein ligase A